MNVALTGPFCSYGTLFSTGSLGSWVPGFLVGEPSGDQLQDIDIMSKVIQDPCSSLKATWTSCEDPQEKKGSPGALAYCGTAVGLASLRVPRSVLVFCEPRRLNFTVKAGTLQLQASPRF